MIGVKAEIGSIFVRPCKNCGNLKAVVSITFHGLVVRGLKLTETAKNGEMILRLDMPSRKRGDDWEDVVFFLDPVARETVCAAVVAEYQKVIGIGMFPSV